jgi:hypothetical protein
MRTIFDFSAENVEGADYLADDAVRFEPLSQGKIPCYREKYREFHESGRV